MEREHRGHPDHRLAGLPREPFGRQLADRAWVETAQRTPPMATWPTWSSASVNFLSGMVRVSAVQHLRIELHESQNEIAILASLLFRDDGESSDRWR